MGSEMMQYLARIGIDDSAFNPTLENMSSKLLAFTTSATAGFALVAAGAVILVQEMQRVASAAHEMEEFAGVTGISVNELQKFQYAAALAGESATAYDGMLAKLTLGMGKAQDAASEQAKAFARLGVNPEGKSTEQVFKEVAIALQGIDDAATRADISMTLYGRSWVEAGKLSNHYLENMENIEKQTYMTSQEVKDAAETQAEWNKMMADGSLGLQGLVLWLDKTSDKVNFLANAMKGAKDEASGADYSGKIPGVDDGVNLASDQAMIDSVNASNKAALAQELSAINQQFTAGKMTAAEYNSERNRITGSMSAMSAGGASGAASGGVQGFDQGSQAGYFAPGVDGSMGVNALTGMPNGFQLSQTNYSDYFDQLTGDKWGPQAYRSEIALQMQYQAALGKYKTKDEMYAATGYNPNGNITIINYNSGNASPAEIANATAESVDRLLAGG